MVCWWYRQRTTQFDSYCPICIKVSFIWGNILFISCLAQRLLSLKHMSTWLCPICLPFSLWHRPSHAAWDVWSTDMGWLGASLAWKCDHQLVRNCKLWLSLTQLGTDMGFIYVWYQTPIWLSNLTQLIIQSVTVFVFQNGLWVCFSKWAKELDSLSVDRLVARWLCPDT